MIYLIWTYSTVRKKGIGHKFLKLGTPSYAVDRASLCMRVIEVRSLIATDLIRLDWVHTLLFTFDSTIFLRMVWSFSRRLLCSLKIVFYTHTHTKIKSYLNIIAGWESQTRTFRLIVSFKQTLGCLRKTPTSDTRYLL